jgi:hypothetical protein
MERAKAEQPSKKARLLHHLMIQDADKECLLVDIAGVVGFSFEEKPVPLG